MIVECCAALLTMIDFFDLKGIVPRGFPDVYFHHRGLKMCMKVKFGLSTVVNQKLLPKIACYLHRTNI